MTPYGELKIIVYSPPGASVELDAAGTETEAAYEKFSDTLQALLPSITPRDWRIEVA